MFYEPAIVFSLLKIRQNILVGWRRGGADNLRGGGGASAGQPGGGPPGESKVSPFRLSLFFALSLFFPWSLSLCHGQENPRNVFI